MIKRILAFIIATIITAAFIISTGVVIVAESENPFASFDANRKAAIEQKRHNLPSQPSYAPLSGEGYIITFNGAKRAVAEALSGYYYRPLAYSSELVFLVYLNDEKSFCDANSDIIEYIEKDITRSVSADTSIENSEGVSQWELQCINATSLPYDKIGDVSKVVVALLDSGINRRHPALAKAHILDGFDITNSYAKVDTDKSGHGTRVAGIIAASTGVTPATGLAQSATILPIRVSENGKDIKTSDLVDAIYMAADANADIINMSFGGYERIRAEEDAIMYAASKGCLMVAASGNEGDLHEFSGKYSYPASYDSVISVASIGQNGVICGFSQYNDMVDIAAPGEFLTLLGDKSGIIYDNGTSFSAAYVSAAAALADAYCQKRLSSDAFERILEYSCGSSTKDEYSGYGVLDVNAVIENCRLPIIYGVSDNTTYFDRVNIFFEGESAYLDGESFADGGSVFSHGDHSLVVRNKYGLRTVNFTLDTIQLKYNYHDMNSYCIFTFNRGKADIDGIPYTSGSRFDLSGKHVFTLCGPNGNKSVKEFELSSGLPYVIGVEDGETYDNTLHITISENGIATLNGVKISNEVFVTETGDYTLELSNSKGSEKSEIHFKINRAPLVYSRTYTTDANLFTDEQNGIAAFSGRNGKSVLVVPLDNPESDGRLLLLPEKIIRIGCIGDKLCVVHAKGAVLYDISTLFSMLPLSVDSYSHSTLINAAVIINDSIYFSDEKGIFYKIPTPSLTPQALLNTEMSIAEIVDADDSLLLYSPDNNGILLYYSIKSGRIFNSFSNLPCGAPISATKKYICCETGVIDFSNAACLLQYSQTATAAIYNDIVITPRTVSKIDGTVIGMYNTDISDISFDRVYNYVLYSDGHLSRIRKAFYFEDTAAFFGAAAHEGYTENPAYDLTPFERCFSIYDRRVTDMKVQNNKLYVIYSGIKSLFVYTADTLQHERTIPLRYFPSALAVNSDDICILFSDVEYIWTKDRGYINIPITPTAIAANSNSIFLIAESKVYVMNNNDMHIRAIMPQISAESIAVNDTTLYIASAFDISAFDIRTLTLLSSTDQIMGGMLICDNNWLLVGSYLLDKQSLSFVTACNAAAFTTTDDAVVTSRGLFDIKNEQYINHRYSGVSMAVKGADNAVYISYDGSIRRIEYYGDPAGEPGFSISDGETVKHGETIECVNGILYLDGIRVENSFVPNVGGNHELTAVLPWGVTHTISFSVKHDPESISVKLSRQHLSPGDTAHLITEILPVGADGDVIYEVEGESIVLAEGVVTAVSIGTSKITARIDGTDIIAYCTVTISGESIKCNNPSYKYVPEGESLSGVAAGTTVEKLIADFVYNGGSLNVLTAEGMIRKSGLVSTGCKLVYHSGANVLESVDISVTGDLDGDGMVTINDADILYSMLRSDTEVSPVIFKSADINGNGIITSADLSLLNGIIGHCQHSSITTVLHPEIEAPSLVGGEATFSVTIKAGELSQSTSMMATLLYDSSVLEYLSSSYFEGSVSASSANGSLFFTALNINSASEDRIIKIYFKVKKPFTGITTLSIENGEVYSGSLYAITRSEKSIRLLPPSKALSAESNNSNLSFLASVNKYSVSVLENETALNISFSLPTGGQLYLPDFTLDGKVSEFVAKYITPSGGTVDYSFIVTKTDKLPVENSSALLSTLSVMESDIKPTFDPLVFLYEVTVDSDCDMITFDYDPVNQGTAIALDAPEKLDFGTNFITVSCKAENGDTATYTLIVNRKHKTSEISEPTEESSESSELPAESIYESSDNSSESNSRPPVQGDSNNIYIVIALCAAALITIITAVTLIRKKR